MTQKDKELLLKDLCARVPYHPKGHVVNACNGAECDEWLTCATFTMFTNITNNCRLYLRPMSSMTEEEKEEYDSIQCDFGIVRVDRVDEIVEFLLSHHFDFRNLIGRGLAIDCTGLNIY